MGFFPQSQESRKPQRINVAHLCVRQKDWEQKSKSNIILLCNNTSSGFCVVKSNLIWGHRRRLGDTFKFFRLLNT